jgi:sugar lactone lactonase YvrE
MIQRIQQLPRSQRLLIFVLFLVGILLFAGAVTLGVILLIFNTSERQQGAALVEGVTVTEWVQLPDEDAYPATVAVSPDGTVYTASYVSGVIWQISPEGNVTEIPNTRDQIGAVTGLALGENGTIYALDRLTSDFRSQGGMIWRVSPDGNITEFGEIDDSSGFVSPDDLTLDGSGNVYVSDRGRREVWRFTPEGIGALWWVVPEDTNDGARVIPTGLAYDASSDTIIITDSETDQIFRVSLDGQTTEVLFMLEAGQTPANLDGVTVAPDGTIYVAALGANRVSRFENGELTALASGFRGASDVAINGTRLYVTNFDQRSLAPPPGLQPRLPFALDVIELTTEN